MSVSRFGGVGVFVSVGLHVGVTLGFLSQSDPAAPPPAPSIVRFEVVEPEKPKPVPPPPKPTTTFPTKESAPRAVARATPEHAPPPATTTTAPSTQPLDLSGVTLTNESGTGWAIDARPATSTPSPSSRMAKKTLPATNPKPARPEVPVVSAADLSKHPSAPALDSQLRNHYPEDARRRGVSGEAVVRARVDPDGRVRTCNVVSESESGFGSACRSTVLGSSWSPPLDREGHPVATYVRYTCRFRVDG